MLHLIKTCQGGSISTMITSYYDVIQEQTHSVGLFMSRCSGGPSWPSIETFLSLKDKAAKATWESHLDTSEHSIEDYLSRVG